MRRLALYTGFTTTSILYAGTDEGVFRRQTTDEETQEGWRQVGFFPDVRAVAIDPMDKDTVYAGTLVNGLFVSTDNGFNWEQLVGGGGDIITFPGFDNPVLPSKTLGDHSRAQVISPEPLPAIAAVCTIDAVPEVFEGSDAVITIARHDQPPYLATVAGRT